LINQINIKDLEQSHDESI